MRALCLFKNVSLS